MIRLSVAAILFGLATLPPAGGFAQGTGGTVPVQQDLKRAEQVDRRLGIDDRPALPDGPGPSAGNPSGVAGFDGPPGTVGDSVGSYGALPPGAPGNDRF